MNVTEARENFSDVINRVAYGHERVCLSRGGKDVACVVSVEEAQILELLEDRFVRISAELTTCIGRS